jgi:teichuronic acid biosynthesis glycosyltransferase TuaC
MKNNLRVLIVCSGNSMNIPPFIIEQAESLKSIGVVYDIFTIKGKGLLGYLKNYFPLLKKVNYYKPTILHAHYGLSGLLAGLQRRVPVIITLHGSDVNLNRNLLFSKIASCLAKHTIVVNNKMVEKLKLNKKCSIIPCGISLEQCYPIDIILSRKMMDFDINKKYILFSSSFDRVEKNYKLAEESIKLLVEKCLLIELKEYSREQVTLLLNACDVALSTSTSEGSPQFIKEALACNCPIVSTNVGDVKWLIENTEACYLCNFMPNDVAEKIQTAFKFSGKRDKINNRRRITELGLDSETIAKRIIEVYNEVISKQKKKNL